MIHEQSKNVDKKKTIKRIKQIVKLTYRINNQTRKKKKNNETSMVREIVRQAK